MKAQKLLAILTFSLMLLVLSLYLPYWFARADELPEVGREAAVSEEPGLIPGLQFKGNVITVTTTADVMANDGQCSLREAIISANENPLLGILGECALGKDDVTDVIILADGATYALTIDGLDFNAQVGDLDIDSNAADLDLRIVVANGGSATIDAQAINDRILENFGATVLVTRVTFKNGRQADDGGAIRNGDGELTLIDSTVSNSQAGYGGGIFNGDILTLINSNVFDNEAINDGGGIYNSDLTFLTVTQSQIRGNRSGAGNNGGGGIYNENEVILVVEDSVINLNETEKDGGGIYSFRSVITITNSLFEGNKTQTGILGGNGGAIYSWREGRITVISTTFDTDNTANNGGAIFNNEFSAMSLEDSLLEDSEAATLGGAIYNRGVMTVSHTTIRQNQAQQGGGLYNNGGKMTIRQQSNIYGNQATATHGGGLYQSGGGLLMTNSSLISNTAAAFGGGIYLIGTEAIFANVTIGANFAGVSGGGLYVDNATTGLHNVTLADNEAISGAALYRTASGNIGLGNSLVSAPLGTACLNSVGKLSSNGHNLFRDDTCAIIEQEGDMINTDPKLGPLTEENGTFVYKPVAGSPALDAGDAATCAGSLVNNIDQVGATRPIGDGCEIGAVETAGAIDPPGEGEGPVQIFLPLMIK